MPESDTAFGDPPFRWSNGEVAVLTIACLLPTLVTMVYFHWASGTPSGTQQLIYAVAKVVQFSLPVAWVAWVDRRSLRLPQWNRRGLGLGALSGLAIGGAIWGLYLLLNGNSLMTQAIGPIQQKTAEVGIASVWRFAAVGLFYSLVHSWLEEYYWRWFVFARFTRFLQVWWAIGISSLAFALHHIVVLWHYFSHAPGLVVLFSASVAVGGVWWAWLYRASGSLRGPWLSHLLVDAAIFTIGMHMMWPLSSTG